MNERENAVPTRAVFLGAGASKAFGYPLTGEILLRIRQKLEQGTLFGAQEFEPERQRLSSLLQSLLPGWQLKDIDLPLITEVLSLIDYSLLSLTAPLPAKSSADLAYFRRLLERAIYDVINDEYKGEPFEIGQQFVDWILKDHRHTGIITTNYDMEIDVGIFDKFKPAEMKTGFDFGFSWRDPELNKIYPRPQYPLFRLYKLHGSVNWLRCDHCEHTYINLDGPIGDLAFDTDPQEYNSCFCGHYMLSLVLVAPSFVRDIRNSDLLHTWKSALELLRWADRWYIIGYSFPAEDLAIRSMFLRAYNGRWDIQGKPPNVTVVQKGQNKAIESRFRSLFPDCTFEWGGLEEFVASLTSNKEPAEN